MAFIPVPGTATVVVPIAIGAITIENVFGYKYSGSFDSSDAAAAGATLAAAYNHLLPAQSTTITYGDMVVTDQASSTGSQFFYTGMTGTHGSDSSNLLPYQTAGLISWTTDTRGRSYRGRTYLGGFCEAASDGRDVNPTLVGYFDDFAGELEADGNFCVISRYELNPTPPPATIPRTTGVASVITGHTSHPLWRTQRGRATR